jgi:hypothetical protein
MIRNITFEPETVAAVCDRRTDSTEAPETILRTRKITVSPSEEYQLRAGSPRPISNELAAAILSFKGRAQIANKGVIVDRKDIGGRYVYFHEDSIIINDFSSREKSYFYVINRLTPEILHLLDETGAYIESLPLRERPAVLDSEAQGKQVRENRTIISRAATRLQQLHAEDTKDRIADLQENSREMQRVVQTLPAPAAQPVQPARSPAGERVAAATRQYQETRANKASALALGRAISMNRRETLDPSDAGEPAEDWSSNTRHTSTTQTHIEQW